MEDWREKYLQMYSEDFSKSNKLKVILEMYSYC